uniref:Uncharacterized protein n=1 Tax=Romanomermis culicivorax TaxID=13658 RepID=A0A915KTC5_ROMCU
MLNGWKKQTNVYEMKKLTRLI